MNIIKNKSIYFIISAAVILIGIGFMIYNYSNGNGLFNFDIQFIGGTSITINNLGEDFDNDDISAIISDVANEKGQIQKVGNTSVNVKTKSLDDAQVTEIKSKVREKYGINFDVEKDEEKGTTITINNLEENFSIDDISAVVSETIEGGKAQKTGDTSASIETPAVLEDSKADELKNKICEKYNRADGAVIETNIEVTTISATISGEMQEKAFMAVLVSCVAMLIYVSLRFRDFKIGASCIIALLHDALVVLACYAVFRIPLNNSFIAAILTVLGYSINASIVIFDRIRENKRRIGSRDTENLVNVSIKQSMRRSVYTSLTTFFTILALYVFGVQSVKEFALPIVVGIVCGTYSSVFLVGSLWYIFNAFGKRPKGAAKTQKNS